MRMCGEAAAGASRYQGKSTCFGCALGGNAHAPPACPPAGGHCWSAERLRFKGCGLLPLPLAWQNHLGHSWCPTPATSAHHHPRHVQALHLPDQAVRPGAPPVQPQRRGGGSLHGRQLALWRAVALRAVPAHPVGAQCACRVRLAAALAPRGVRCALRVPAPPRLLVPTNPLLRLLLALLLLAHRRGRTLWFLGDSQTSHFFYAVSECTAGACSPTGPAAAARAPCVPAGRPAGWLQLRAALPPYCYSLCPAPPRPAHSPTQTSPTPPPRPSASFENLRPPCAATRPLKKPSTCS